MLPRVPEPEPDDESVEIAAYAAMPHSEVNSAFVADLLAAFAVGARATAAPPRVLDVGTGPAAIPALLVQQQPDWQIVASDFSPLMLETAHSQWDAEGFDQRIDFVVADAADLPFADTTFDVVFSNSLIHHLPDPAPAIREMVRVLHPGGLLFLRDLFRPESADVVEALVAKHAADATAEQQQLLRQSLHASFTLGEIEQIVSTIPNLRATITQTSDRHWTLTGRREN